MIDWRDAINSRRIVRFSYEGLERIVIPAAYGLNRRTGNELLRAYQVEGRDATRRIPTWSLFNIANVVGASLTGEHFEALPPGYRRNNGAMDVIYAQL
jgi:hypothetical protein